jgi:hypothetical protein
MPRDHKREECGPIFLQKKHILNIGDLVFFKGLECKKKIDCKVQSGFWGGLLVLKMFHFLISGQDEKASRWRSWPRWVATEVGLI